MREHSLAQVHQMYMAAAAAYRHCMDSCMEQHVPSAAACTGTTQRTHLLARTAILAGAASCALALLATGHLCCRLTGPAVKGAQQAHKRLLMLFQEDMRQSGAAAWRWAAKSRLLRWTAPIPEPGQLSPRGCCQSSDDVIRGRM
jgi:hypothetical protein